MATIRKKYTLAVTVGQNIAQKRKTKGLTQAEMAEQLGIGADSLSRTEKGSIAPRFPRLEHIAAILGCAVADLFRTANDDVHSKAQHLADMMRHLEPKAQDELVELVSKVIAFRHLH